MPVKQEMRDVKTSIATVILLLLVLSWAGYATYTKHHVCIQGNSTTRHNDSDSLQTQTDTNTTIPKDTLVVHEDTSTDSYNELIAKANVFFNNQQYDEAIQNYTEALQIKPDKEFPKQRIDEITTLQIKQKREDFLKDKVVLVQGGTFNMGSENGDFDENPAHEVSISSFYINRFEVTVAEYRIFCTTTARQMPPAPPWGWIDDHPIVNVNWQDANEYAKWAGKRLPTEAEWEFAARGGIASKGYMYSGSNDPNEVAWHLDNSQGTSHPVGLKKGNELGLYDMTGNVVEWCSDWYDRDYYGFSEVQDPTGPFFGEQKTMRGGSWYSELKYLTLTFRNNGKETYRYTNIGFRLAWSTQ